MTWNLRDRYGPIPAADMRRKMAAWRENKLHADARDEAFIISPFPHEVESAYINDQPVDPDAFLGSELECGHLPFAHATNKWASFKSTITAAVASRVRVAAPYDEDEWGSFKGGVALAAALITLVLFAWLGEW